MQKSILFALSLGVFYHQCDAQTPSTLYIASVKSQGYVAGSKLAASGVHRYDGADEWTHMGWNLPRVRALSYDSRNPETFFLASSNGIARSRDRGKTWRMTTDWRVTEALDVCVDPSNPQHVYVATAHGIWVSKDGGETWAESHDGIARKYAQSVQVDRAQTGRVFAGTERGLYLSVNGGSHWSLIGSQDVTILDLAQSASTPQQWIAATQAHSVMLSHDNGNTWQFVQGKLARAAVYVVAIDPFDKQNLCAVTWGMGAFVSTDGGKNWNERNAGVPTNNLYATVFDANRAGRLWVATFEEGVFFSNDFGRTWQEAGMRGAIVFDMMFVPAVKH